MLRVAPVPEGFIISTGICEDFFAHNGLSRQIKTDIISSLNCLESETKTKYGTVENGVCPLLISLRPSPRTILHG